MLRYKMNFASQRRGWNQRGRALRTFTGGISARVDERGNGFSGDSAQSGGDQHKVEERGVAQAIENITTIAVVGQDVRFAEGHQVLGDVCLPPAKHCFEVTDAGFARPDGEQNGKTGGRRDRFEQDANLLGDLGNRHILGHEYILQYIRKTEYDKRKRIPPKGVTFWLWAEMLENGRAPAFVDQPIVRGVHQIRK
jgi:hypothetical protein